MKTILILFLFFFPQKSIAIHVVSVEAHIDIVTEKVTHVDGIITSSSATSYMLQTIATQNIPGARVVIIDSPGGVVSAGQSMINQMEEEKAKGVKQICVVSKEASSAAFNLLTHCDVRLAVPDAHMLVHKIFLWEWPLRMKVSAKNLRDVADDLDLADEPYRQANSKAMMLTLKDYDKYADAETVWSTRVLLEMHYLAGIATLF